MGAAGRAFSWVPKVDLYPLFTVCGAAVGVCAYSCFRHFATNPDVAVARSNRVNGPVDNAATLEHAKSHYSSVFRRMALTRYTKGEERPDVRIFQ